MSTVSVPSRFYRVAADAIGVAAGLAIVVLSVSHPDLATVGGIGLVTISVSQLHSDLESSGA